MPFPIKGLIILSGFKTSEVPVRPSNPWAASHQDRLRVVELLIVSKDYEFRAYDYDTHDPGRATDLNIKTSKECAGSGAVLKS